jgi:hypothetical protein
MQTGIRQHYFSEIENGLQNLILDTMTALARARGQRRSHPPPAPV